MDARQGAPRKVLWSATPDGRTPLSPLLPLCAPRAHKSLACSVLLNASMPASVVPASPGSVFWPRLSARSLQPSPRSSCSRTKWRKRTWGNGDAKAHHG